MHGSRSDQRALTGLLIGAALIGSNGLMVRLADMPSTVLAFACPSSRLEPDGAGLS